MRVSRPVFQTCCDSDVTIAGLSAPRNTARCSKLWSVLRDASSMYHRHLSYYLFNLQIASRASALATDCEVEVVADPMKSMMELRQNKALGMDPPLSPRITITSRICGIPQGKRSSGFSTRSTGWSIECMVSLLHRQISWVFHPSRPVPMHIL